MKSFGLLIKTNFFVTLPYPVPKVHWITLKKGTDSGVSSYGGQTQLHLRRHEAEPKNERQTVFCANTVLPFCAFGSSERTSDHSKEQHEY